MTMRLLPWVRRGLAGAIDHTDDLGTLPANTTFGVTVKLVSDTGGRTEATADIGLLGPGNVTGVDTRSIIRTEPGRYATNVEPDSFVVLEFDDPDFPWMFTPARAGTDNRLRPWLVLIVVEDRDGVDISAGSGPLPRLVIDEPALPAEELPDLDESWAWAHAQVITEAAADSIAANLTGDPDRNLSRLLCPRRLHPDRSYIAALVPAFDQGVSTGMGSVEIPRTDIGPAWNHAALGPRITLPVYYHWTFRTGAAGNFESLARQLEPLPLPDGVGSAPMYIGAADPAIRTLDGPASIATMEGALRSITAPSPRPIDAGFTDDLITAVDAANQDSIDAVGPPIYGGRHVERRTIPGTNRVHRWLRDINAEVRNRAAAGLGVDVVRTNQEAYVDEAWEQVGDVMRANHLLRMAAIMEMLARRLHERHVVGVDPGRLLSMTAQSHRLLRFGSTSVAMAHRASATPDALTNPAMRRAISPHNAHLKLGARRFDVATDASGGLALSKAATHGLIKQDLASTPPGINDATVVGAVFSQFADLVDSATAADVKALVGMAREANAKLDGFPSGTITLRPDLATVGLASAGHLEVARELAGLDQPVSAMLHRLQPFTAPDGDGSLVGYGIGNDGMISPILRASDNKVVAIQDGVRVDLSGALVEQLKVSIGGRVGPNIGGVGGRSRVSTNRRDEFITPTTVTRTRLTPGVSSPTRSNPTRLNPTIGTPITGTPTIGTPITGTPIVVTPTTIRTDPPITIDRPPVPQPTATPVVIIIEPLITTVDVLGDYVETFKNQMVTVDQLVPTVADVAALDIDSVGAAIIEQSNPVPAIHARVAERVRIDGLHLTAEDTFRMPRDVADIVDLWQPKPVSPVMVGPRLNRALYRDLANHDQERFLPGVGQIPDNALTLLATNPAFVEAFMVGVNHEFNRELLWRRYPTDARGTAFRAFWDNVDGSPDIEAIHTWPGNQRLGSLSGGSPEGSVVLLVRGNLLKRYPNTVIYASPANAAGKIDAAADVRLPVFAGSLKPDISFAGFDLSPTEVLAGDGWMFVLQEQPSEPRFGLDSPDPDLAGLPRQWSDLHWGHAAIEPGGHLRVGDLAALDLPISDAAGAPRVRLARNSAGLAAATFQQPFRAAIHSREILDVM